MKLEVRVDESKFGYEEVINGANLFLKDISSVKNGAVCLRQGKVGCTAGRGKHNTLE